MPAIPPDQDPSSDALYARNATRIYLNVTLPGGKPQRVGRVQSMREDITNNVQVLDELGRAYAVELKKGITHYTFSIAKFYCRSDVFDSLKLGSIFGLSISDHNNAYSAYSTLEYFSRCAITAISRDFTIGQAVVGENATVVTIGKGIEIPAAL